MTKLLFSSIGILDIDNPYTQIAKQYSNTTFAKKEKPRFRGFCVLLERETRLELATPTLARLCSTN